jgi:thiamine transporter
MNKNTLRLVECGVLIALALALSFVRLFNMPLGGSITLCSMLPIMLLSFRHGIKWGLGAAFAFSLVHLMISMFVFGELLSWGLTAQAIVVSIFLDYILAFTSLGLAGIFGTKLPQYIAGMTFAVVVRYAFHIISGVTIFASWLPKDFPIQNTFVYSLAYNSFLWPEFALCLIASIMLYVPLKKYMRSTEKRVHS